MNARLLRERAEMTKPPGAEEDDLSTCLDDGTAAKSEISERGSELGGPVDNAEGELKAEEEESKIGDNTPMLSDPKEEDELPADMKLWICRARRAQRQRGPRGWAAQANRRHGKR